MLPLSLPPHAFSVIGKGGLIGGVLSFINPTTEEEKILLLFLATSVPYSGVGPGG